MVLGLFPLSKSIFYLSHSKEKSMSKEEKQEWNVIFGIYIFIYFSTNNLFVLTYIIK